MDHDAPMFIGRRDVHESAFRQLALVVTFLLFLLVFTEHFELGVIDRRVVLSRALQVVDVPGADHRLHDARQLCLCIAGVPHPEHQRGRRQPRNGGGVIVVEKGAEGPIGFFQELGGPNQSVAQPVPRFEEGHRLVVAVSDGYLWHQCGARVLRLAAGCRLEQGLHPVGLGADAVDRRDLRAVRQCVDVVADTGVGRREGVGRWKDDRICTLHRQVLLPQRERNGAGRIIRTALDECIVEFDRHVKGSSVTSVIQRAWFSCPGQSSCIRNRRSGMPGNRGCRVPKAARRKIEG